MSLKLQELDWQNIGHWPLRAKLTLIVGLCLLLVIIGYVAVIRGQQLRLSHVVDNELKLKATFQQKHDRIRALTANQQQYRAMQDAFSHMRQHMSDGADMTNLLQTISQLGNTSGLEFSLVKPMPEMDSEFYTVLPIHVVALGDYHQFAEFTSELLKLPGMVTVGDFTLQRIGDSDRLEVEIQDESRKTRVYNLSMEMVIETYQYPKMEL